MKLNLLLIAGLFSMAAMTSCGNSNKKAPATDSIVGTETIVEETTQETKTATTPAKDVVVELKANEALPDNGKPTVIDFNATWCGPCKNFAPTFHKVAADYAEKANFLSVDVDVCEKLAKEFNVTNIPMIAIVYPKSAGKQPVTKVGFMSEQEFTALLNSNL